MEQISYDHNSPFFQNLIKPDHHLHPQVNYPSGLNVNDRWQRPNTNSYRYQPYQGYRPPNGGWYVASPQLVNQGWAENQNPFWNNQGQSIIAHSSVMCIALTILIFCH